MDEEADRANDKPGGRGSPAPPTPARCGPPNLDLAAQTAKVAVRVQQPAELGLDESCGPRAFGDADALAGAPEWSSDLARRLATALAQMPSAGADFMGFHILAELGHGAFGRVYLAQQQDLARRSVALKVSTDLFGEAQALAQLQHTNIVPIYSVHHASPYQAVCMPYFGATTLADLLESWRERRLLPASGRDLVSTLCNRKSLTRDLAEQTDNQASPAGPQPPAYSPAMPVVQPLAGLRKPKGTAILEMLGSLSYVQAVLWIATRLADGLAHAHERGILHRDLKPANVLLTDEGQPMLLDFSVAEDLKIRSAASASQVGGTLYYMAPEHLEAFMGSQRTVDNRSDLYSLGIILFEMLTRREPFPRHQGKVRDAVPRMLADRQGPPPWLHAWNRAITPAVESIVRHCLEPDPARRYQSVQELREDLERHRANLPLKFAPEPSSRERTQKWLRRHPRLTSLSTLSIVSVILLVGCIGWSMVRSQRLGQLEAQATLQRFHEEVKTVQFLLNARSLDGDQLADGLQLGREALATYHVVDNPAWEGLPAVRNLTEANQQQLHDELEDLFVLLARATQLQALAARASAARGRGLQEAEHLNELAEKVSRQPGPGQAVLAQRAALKQYLGDQEAAGRLRAQAAAMPLQTARDYYQAGSQALALGHYRAALPLFQAAVNQEPPNFWYHLLLALCYDGMEQYREARSCYTTSIALWPAFPWTYFNRGLVCLRQNDFPNALEDFNRFVTLRPDFVEVYINRALSYQGLKRYAEAVADLTRALEKGAPFTRIYFLRARARDLAGDKQGAKQDLAEGMRRQPTDYKSYLARGLAKLPKDMPGALADFRAAEELSPRCLAVLQNQAHVLSEMGRNQESAQILDRELELYPDYVPARVGRGVIRARLNQRPAALQDAEDALARDNSPAVLYQVACIYALTSRLQAEDRFEALRYLALALRRGYGLDLLADDADLDAIRPLPEFRRLVAATQALKVSPPKPGKASSPAH
jgi:serine/threonine protein kinase/tetratricopeptide (TPR) repeat protein